jgi:protease-4
VRRSLAFVTVAACAALSGCAVVLADFELFDRKPEPLRETVVQGEGDDKIVLLDISRVITAEEQESTLGLRRRDSTVSRVAQVLEQVSEDEDVKALVLRINSPGGTVGASDIVYHQIRAYAAKKSVPVVAQLLDIGTSGAYYVALAADEVIAQPTSVTGSIGVILFGLNVEGLLDKVGVRDQTLKAGENKDLGSPLRPLRPDERAILQGVLDAMHTRFIDLVRARRPSLVDGDVARATDGRIFTADQALELGLIDRIGYLDDAIGAARRRAGLAQAKVVVYTRPSEYSENIYSSASFAPAQVNLVNFDLGALAYGEAQFMYLWRPGLAGSL